MTTVIGKQTGTEGKAGAEKRHPTVELRQQDGAHVCELRGVWNTRRVQEVDAQMRRVEDDASIRTLVIDLRQLISIDTAGAWLVERLRAAQIKRGAEVKVVGQSEGAEILFEAIRAAIKEEAPAPRRRWSPLDALEKLGRTTADLWNDFLLGMNILGATIRGAQMKLGRGHAVNPAAIFNQMDQMGVGAIPVIVLMSTIVGAIIAQQGAFQLRYFGAEIFVVDLVGVLILREMGVLLTAIMVAGRTGSAITAELGSMKMREEVDALKVIGLNPIGVLVFPRLVALVVVLPCLTVIANFAALGGAMAVAWTYSGISPEAFMDRLREFIDLSTILAGLIKAPFMALVIGIIASVEGLKVGGSAESLGRHVTSSVVKAIFFVIVLDGLFAMFYAAIEF
jgi:phospholipid/cholesterol/gamma-HCH transport system permease protein